MGTRLRPRADSLPKGLLQIDGETLLATIYRQQSDSERGLYHHLRALKLAEEHHSRTYTVLLIRSANFLMDEGRIEEARAVLNRALERDERGPAVHITCCQERLRWQGHDLACDQAAAAGVAGVADFDAYPTLSLDTGPSAVAFAAALPLAAAVPFARRSAVRDRWEAARA